MSEISKELQYKLLDVQTGEERGQLKRFGGSEHDAFNYTLLKQAEDTVPWRSELRDQDRLQEASFGAMIGMQPRDEFEGMLITQLLAAHHAAIECYRIGRRHRGKGKQQIRVEHVHVNQGGQAIVGVVNREEARPSKDVGEADAAKVIEHQPETPMRGVDPQRETVSVSARDRGEALPGARPRG